MSPIIRHEKESVKDCPQCDVVLEVKPEEDGFFIRCSRHGHEAKGYSPEQTIHHWNLYVEWIIRQAAIDAADRHEAPIEHSYCCFCERKTPSTVSISTTDDYEVECGFCHLKKYRKEATRANRLFK